MFADLRHAALMRECLERMDVAVFRKLTAVVAPQMKHSKTDQDARIVMHMARTQMPNMPLKHRAYSHRWLCDNGFPSQLPDELKPRAEQMYPKVVEAVGTACKDQGAGIAPFIEQAMSDRVKDIYATDRANFSPDPLGVRRSILEVRAAKRRQYADLLRDFEISLKRAN